MYNIVGKQWNMVQNITDLSDGSMTSKKNEFKSK